ncbi:MAG: hypothetical protein P0Y55_08535 [Candidatus Cohnella colombiensis]|uniref:Uncharacterized protein n=1 Tax=Candidatus Cohnella colombiensis TaxID=3121368 RepID=A0AA95JH54_9BACL|nr:MAG: hypothetical protein P0Y55_08535 [Cohnella sp.]
MSNLALSKKIIVFICVLFICTPLSISADSLSYSSSRDHFSISLPDGWIQMPQSVIDEAMQFMKQQATDPMKIPQYFAGFQREAETYFQYPYILMQRLDNSDGVSIEEVKKTFRQYGDDTLKKLDENLDIIKNATLDDSPFIYQEKNAVLFNMITDVQGIGKVKSLSAMMLGKNGIISLHFYSLENEYLNDLPYFSSILDSFNYEDGYEYQEPQSFWEQVATKAVIGAIIGGVFALFGVIVKRNKKAAIATSKDTKDSVIENN